MGTNIEIEGVSVILGKRDVLRDVSATIPEGKLTAIIGPNGAGKTTLLRCILGLQRFSGNISINGQNISFGHHFNIGYVPQKIELDRGLPLTVMEFMSLCVGWKPVFLGIGKKKKNELEECLDKVNGKVLRERRLSDLSGGEMQRVLLAKAICGKPEILLFDEPASGIDMAGEELFCDILDDIQVESGSTVVMVSHDLNVVSSHADFVLCLDQTIKCSGSPVEVMTSENILTLFGDHSGIFVHGDDHGGICNHTDPPPSSGDRAK